MHLASRSTSESFTLREPWEGPRSGDSGVDRLSRRRPKSHGAVGVVGLELLTSAILPTLESPCRVQKPLTTRFPVASHDRGEANLRVLVVIAHHGTKNRPFLLRMLQSFNRMEHDVDVVVVCEEPKDLPHYVEQVVGMPSDDPWSLPFAHRPIFIDRAADYDLFVYSEDDTLIEQAHLDRFVQLQAWLPKDMIAGFMRFEEHPDGSRSYSTINSHYRWLPNSVRRIGDFTFARFANDHAACYALTRDQLERAILSGGFDVRPHAGRYDMLVTAATDVYTQCGMTKFLCIEHIEDQLVHHMPNVYLGKMGVDEKSFRSQLEALRNLPVDRPIEQFLVPETKTPDAFWDRRSFPIQPTELIRAFENRPASRVLNIAGTTGDLETALLGFGHQVTSIPADPVFDRVLTDRGVETIPGTSVKDASADNRFDHVLAIDVLPYLSDPVSFLSAVKRLLADTGRVVVSVPDHRRYRLRNRIQPSKSVSSPVGFREDGVHPTDPRVLRGWLRTAGLEVVRLTHRSATRREPFGSGGWRSILVGNAVVAVAAPY